MLNSILYLIFYLNGIGLHDFHVSVCNIEYDDDRKALEVTHRIFLDDLETALRQSSGNQKIDVTKSVKEEQFQQTLKAYIFSEFSIKANNKQVEMNYIGSEIEDDVMYCYIDIVGIKKIKSIEVKNSLLIDLYSDQSNIVHVKVNGEKRSLKLDGKRSVDSLEY